MQRYDFPDDPLSTDTAVIQTAFAAINDNGLAIGNAGLQIGDLLDLGLKNQAFLVQLDSNGNIDEMSVEEISLPCPTCVAFIDFSDPENIQFSQAGRSVATNLSDTGLIVGFNDNNDGFFSGFIGVPIPDNGSPGDFDLDSDIDGADFLAWQRGESPSPLSATDLMI